MRILGIAKWVLAMFAGVLVMAWIASCRAPLQWELGNNLSGSVWRGWVTCIRWKRLETVEPMGLPRVGRGDDVDANLQLGRHPLLGEYVLHAPIWRIAAAMGGASVGLWVLGAFIQRRFGVEHCVGCGYCRAGLANEARCPECGAGLLRERSPG